MKTILKMVVAGAVPAALVAGWTDVAGQTTGTVGSALRSQLASQAANGWLVEEHWAQSILQAVVAGSTPVVALAGATAGMVAAGEAAAMLPAKQSAWRPERNMIISGMRR